MGGKRKAKADTALKKTVQTKKRKLEESKNKKPSEMFLKSNKSNETSEKPKKAKTAKLQSNKNVKVVKPEKSVQKRQQNKKKIKEPKVLKDRKTDLGNIPGFDHVPSDSEDENKQQLFERSDTNQKNTNEKKLYTDFTHNTVFVGNLPLTYNKNRIVKVFSKFGKVINARVRCVPIANINMRKKVAAIKKEFNPNRNSMVAYVKFDSEYGVLAAVAANGMVLDNHHLRIDHANNTSERDTNKAVFVGGLPFGIEDDELWNFFEKCGKINSVRVVRDSHTSMGKGIGYVNFDSTAAVELALQLDGQELNKRIINVKRCINTGKKNKEKSFDRKKTKETVGQLLSKKNKAKLKEKKKKSEKTHKPNGAEFLGTKATMKTKKKKKPSKDALRKKQLINIFKKKQ